MRAHLKAQARSVWRALAGQIGVPDGEALVVDFLGYLPHVPDQKREMLAAHMLAYRTYQPQLYGGRLTLFRARALPLRLSYDPELELGQVGDRRGAGRRSSRAITATFSARRKWSGLAARLAGEPGRGAGSRSCPCEQAGPREP